MYSRCDGHGVLSQVLMISLLLLIFWKTVMNHTSYGLMLAPVLFLLCSLPNVLSAQSIDLANLKGWNIVVSGDAIPSERKAAQEFQHFYKQASGIELPIVAAVDRPGRHVFIGPSQALADSEVRINTADMGDEALRIVVSRDNIAIAGGRPRGTLYGVYTFLENHLGVRFLTSAHTHIPRIPQGTTLEPTDFSYDPPIVFRWSYWHDVNQNGEFAARTRNNALPKQPAELGGRTRYELINHFMHRFINTKTYGQEHPEYFALIDGKRRVDTNGGDAHYYGTQLCMTHPDVIRIITEKALQNLRKHPNPNQQILQMGQGDNTYYCQCETCAAIDEREGTHMGSLLWGINQIAEAVAKEFPGVKLGILAYSYSIKPPKTLRAHPSVLVQICNIGASVTLPIEDISSKRNAEFAQDLRGWRDKASNISIWTYSTNFHEFLLPTTSLHIWGRNIRHYRDNGISQFFVQGNTQSPGGAFSDVTNYVISRLLWDPTQDSEALMNEFLLLHYGAAGEPVRQYLNLVFKQYADKKIDQYCNGTGALFGFDAQSVQAGLEAYRQAMQLSPSKEVEERLEFFKLWMYRAAIEDVWAPLNPWRKSGRQAGESIPAWLTRLGSPAGCVDPVDQQRTRPYIREIFQLIDKHQVTRWRENMDVSIAQEILRHGFGLKPDEAW
jgi:hypothetical protein